MASKSKRVHFFISHTPKPKTTQEMLSDEKCQNEIRNHELILYEE